jgi:hypothetical protein
MSSFSNNVSIDYNMLEDGLMRSFNQRSSSRKDQKQFRQRYNNKLVRDLSIRETIGNITKKEQKSLNGLQKHNILKQFDKKKTLTDNAIVRHRDTKWQSIIYSGDIYTYTQEEIAERDEIPEPESVDTERWATESYDSDDEDSSYHKYLRERKLRHFEKATNKKRVHFDDDLPVYIM